MKPAPFKYHAPSTVEEALGHLARHGWDAKVLAGGQSLIPMMNFRLAQPAVLVDLNNVSELFYIHPGRDGGVRVGSRDRKPFGFAATPGRERLSPWAETANSQHSTLNSQRSTTHG